MTTMHVCLSRAKTTKNLPLFLQGIAQPLPFLKQEAFKRRFPRRRAPFQNGLLGFGQPTSRFSKEAFKDSSLRDIQKHRHNRRFCNQTDSGQSCSPCRRRLSCRHHRFSSPRTRAQSPRMRQAGIFGMMPLSADAPFENFMGPELLLLSLGSPAGEAVPAALDLCVVVTFVMKFFGTNLARLIFVFESKKNSGAPQAQTVTDGKVLSDKERKVQDIRKLTAGTSSPSP